MEPLFELLAEIGLNVLFEWLFGTFGRPTVTRRSLLSVVAVVAGGGLGWASTALLARPLIPWVGARILYVIVVPPLIAAFIDFLARVREEDGRRPGLLNNWLDAYLFAVAFSLTRFFATL